MSPLTSRLLVFALYGLVSLMGLHTSALADDPTMGGQFRLPQNAVDALSTGTEFILYSLDPGPLSLEPQKIKPEENFNGFKMIGRLPLTDPKSRAVAVKVVTDAIGKSDYHFIKMCFSPRHALRVTSNGQIFDFIICYSCGQIKLYEKGAVVARIGIPSDPAPLNELLTAAGIPLGTPPPPNK